MAALPEKAETEGTEIVAASEAGGIGVPPENQTDGKGARTSGKDGKSGQGKVGGTGGGGGGGKKKKGGKK